MIRAEPPLCPSTGCGIRHLLDLTFYHLCVSILPQMYLSGLALLYTLLFELFAYHMCTANCWDVCIWDSMKRL